MLVDDRLYTAALPDLGKVPAVLNMSWVGGALCSDLLQADVRMTKQAKAE